MTSIKQFYLLKLIEECSEVAQQAAKQIQFGHFSTSQTTGKRYDNTALLRAEVNDILATLDVLMDLGELPEISPQELLEAKNKKRNRIMEYLQHSQALGLVEKNFKDYEAVEYPHRFGSMSDLCIDCGIGTGWFGRNYGKPCPERKQTKKFERGYCGCREYPDGDACLLPNNHDGRHDWQNKP